MVHIVQSPPQESNQKGIEQPGNARTEVGATSWLMKEREYIRLTALGSDPHTKHRNLPWSAVWYRQGELIVEECPVHPGFHLGICCAFPFC